jgi:hypothetical protein
MVVASAGGLLRQRWRAFLVFVESLLFHAAAPQHTNCKGGAVQRQGTIQLL